MSLVGRVVDVVVLLWCFVLLGWWGPLVDVDDAPRILWGSIIPKLASLLAARLLMNVMRLTCMETYLHPIYL